MALRKDDPRKLRKLGSSGLESGEEFLHRRKWSQRTPLQTEDGEYRKGDSKSLPNGGLTPSGKRMKLLLREFKDAKRNDDYARMFSLVERMQKEGIMDAGIITFLIGFYGKCGQFERAKRVFEGGKAASDPQMHCAMMKACSIEGRWQEAESTLKECEAHGFRFPHLYMLAITSAVRGGNIAKAAEFFEMAKNRGLADGKTYAAMYAAYSSLGLCGDADALFKKAVEGGMDTTCLFHEIMAECYEKGEYAAAVALYSGLPKEAKTNPDIVFAVAEALRKNPKTRWQAISILESFLQNRPKNDYGDWRYVRACTIMAFALKDVGQLERASSEFLRLMRNVHSRQRDYPRILCGCVFSDALATPEQKRGAKSALSMELLRAKGNLKLDIEFALKRL
ncbi:MAG: tetratricopeptide repeat protein [Candidatus Micrarchaeia archaeon]